MNNQDYRQQMDARLQALEEMIKKAEQKRDQS